MAPAQIGFATSIDLVQQQHYSTDTGPFHGFKRDHGQIDESFSGNVVFKDITNFTLGPDIGKRQRSNAGEKNRIKTSRICNVGDNNTDASHILKPVVSSTPGPSQNPLLSLSNTRYGLPQTLVKNFASLGINSIYPWQSSCLLGGGILEGKKNLVYTAPTGGGKSLVADVLMLKRIIEDPFKKAILVLPYVALVQEKLKWLRKVVDGLTKGVYTRSQGDVPSTQLPRWRKPHSSSVRVGGFFGGSKARVTWSEVDIAVCTFEKVGNLQSFHLSETVSCTPKNLH